MLIAPERNYTVWELECLWMKWAIKKLRAYVEGLHFETGGIRIGQTVGVRHLKRHRQDKRADVDVWLVTHILKEHRDWPDLGVLYQSQCFTSALPDCLFSVGLGHPETGQPTSARPSRLPEGFLDTGSGAYNYRDLQQRGSKRLIAILYFSVLLLILLKLYRGVFKFRVIIAIVKFVNSTSRVTSQLKQHPSSSSSLWFTERREAAVTREGKLPWTYVSLMSIW